MTPGALLGLAFTWGDAPRQRSILLSLQSISKATSEVWHWWTRRFWLQSSIQPRGIRCAWHHCRPVKFFYTPLEEESISFSSAAWRTQVTFSQRKMARPQLQQHKQRFTSPWHLAARRRKEGKTDFSRAKSMGIGSRRKQLWFSGADASRVCGIDVTAVVTWAV